ncbi:MAG: hypothetical protein WBD22_06210 [Pyrinomonadaceae bacterium]
MWRNENGRWYGREELFDLIWSKSIQQLAKEFGMSDVALAKKCKAVGLPRPGRGYWAKIEAGMKVRKPNLPKAPRGQVDRVWITTRPVAKMEVVKLDQQVLEEVAELLIPENRIKVRTDFKGAHELVRNSRKLLSAGQVSEYGRLFKRVADGACLDVSVSRQALDRTLLLFDAILNTLEKHRFAIKTTDDRGQHGTYLIRDGVEMKLSAFEKSNRSDHVPTAKELKNEKEYRWSYRQKWDYSPSGEIEIVLTRWPLNERHWKDLKSVSLEERVTDIVCEIIESNELLRIEDAKREEIRRRELEERRLAKIRRRVEAEELKRRQELIQQAIDWDTAAKIRSYLKVCMASVEELPADDTNREGMVDWIKWGSINADLIDPIKNGAQSSLMERSLDPPDVETDFVDYR